MIAVGKFSTQPVVRFTSRWQVSVQEPLSFHDPKHGLLTVPAGFDSDLASIRILREVSRAAWLLSLACWFFAWSWVANTLLVLAIGSLALYALLAGYGLRAAILHDWLYTTALLPRAAADAVFYRALRTGDGTARWRALFFWVGVRVGGIYAYSIAPV